MSESQANQALTAAYGRFADERARWAQVLGTTGKRKQAKPAHWSFISVVLAMLAN